MENDDDYCDDCPNPAGCYAMGKCAMPDAKEPRQSGSERRLVRLEGITAKALLSRWMTKYAPTCRPGGWDYDKDAAALCEETAELLQTHVPW